MPLEDVLDWVAPDGRRAVLRVEDGTVAVDIEWAGGPERWTQSLGDDESVQTLFASYRDRLARAGFAPLASVGAALRPHAALRVAELLRPSAPALADLIEADLDDRADAVARACQRVSRSERSLVGGLPPLDDAISVLGGFVWTYDDDHLQSTGPDPVWTELEEVLRGRRPVQLHAQVFNAYQPARDAIARAGALDALTHLLLTPLRPAGVRGEPPPRLLSLTGTLRVIEPWLAEPEALPTLEALTLHGDVVRPRDWLDRLAGLPSLRHLGIATTDAEPILTHPLIGRLETLDLRSTEPGPALALVDAHRDRLRHLRRLFLPGHLVSPDVRMELADLPARFVSHDRVEVLGHDLMRQGYPGGCR